MMLLIFFNLAVSTVFCLPMFSTNLFMTHSRLERWKNDERLVLSFHFVSFVLNVIVFVYNGLKQSHILQTMPNRLLQIYFFHRNLIYVYLKNSILRCMWRDFGMSLPLCYLHWFASLKLTKFVYVSSLIPSYLKLAKLHTGFSTNPCFLRMG